MFLNAKIDENKTTIPVKFLSRLGNIGATVYIIKGPEKCLYLFSLNNLEEIKKIFGGIPSLDMIQIKRLRKIYISNSNIEHAGLKNEVVFVDCGKYFEIWNNQRWIKDKEKAHKAMVTVLDSKKN